MDLFSSFRLNIGNGGRGQQWESEMPSPSDHPRRLIWFCNTESVADHPETLVRLRDEIGLTTIMPESHVCHTSGFAASPEIAARGPFEDWREREDKWPKAAQGIYPPVAGTVSGYDDGPLLSLIDSARQAGIEVWGHFGLWSYGGEVYPEFALTDLQGNSLGREGSQSAWGTGLCPSRRRINEWVVDCLRALVRRYDVDGFCVDHARYPPPANPASLLACGCADCRRESGALGYDFEAMLEGLAELRSGMAAADAVSLLTTAGEAANLWEFLSGFGGGDAARLWFESRAALLAARMGEFREAVRTAAPSMVFGSDLFAPSIALLGGQNYSEWEDVTDYLTGGSSHGGVVGWGTSVTNLAAVWAEVICDRVPGVGDEDVLGPIYALFGCGHLQLPLTRPGLEQGGLPLAELFEWEVSQLVKLSSGRVPRYPPISAGGNPELVRRLCRAVVEAGCDGAMLSLDPANGAILNVLSEELGAL